ncbi:MAG: hypothetical protein QM539_10160 [Alphaproteobacteria bacterium]|nr:hypothetical protein [Alphaproteobacteria bacterium]
MTSKVTESSIISPEFQNSNSGFEITVDQVVLGKKLENPFKLETMKKALNNLKGNSKYQTYAEHYPSITKTHRYIKFNPQTEDEANIMYKWDTLHLLSTTPFDYEILKAGQSYREPNLKDGQPSPMYANVPIDISLPQHVKYEVLDDIYVPSILAPDVNVKNSKQRFDNDANTAYNDLCDEILLMEAYKLTNVIDKSFNQENYLDELIFENSKNQKENIIVNPGTQPDETINISGRIFYDVNFYFPIHGLRVTIKARFLGLVHQVNYDSRQSRIVPYVENHSTNTNTLGEFNLNVTKRILNHMAMLSFALNISGQGPENAFRITNNNNDLISIISPKLTSNLAYYDTNVLKTVSNINLGNLYINSDSVHNYYFTVFNAAYFYYFGDIGGLSRPPSRFNTGLTIKCYTTFGRSTADYSRQTIWGGAHIHMHEFGSDNIRTFAITIHELAHAAHWDMVKSITFRFERTDAIVTESYAKGVEWFLTKRKYPDYNTGYIRGTYTGICQDLIDTPKMVTTYDYQPGDPDANSEIISLSYNDRVQGFTMPQIEAALRSTGVTSFNAWQICIYNQNPKNNNREYISEAFRYWNSYNSFTPDFVPPPMPTPPPPRIIPTPREGGEFCYPEEGTNRRICL